MKMRLPNCRLFLAWLVVTVPLSPASHAANAPALTHWNMTPAGLQLEWSGPVAGTNYTVQTRDSVGESVWLMPLETTCWPIPGTQWTDSWALSNRARFYRVLAVPAAQRGRLLSSTLSRTLATNEISSYFTLARIPIRAEYAVRLYKVGYETITPWGARTRASGAMCLPLNTSGLLPLVSYQHGTITQTNTAPSAMNLFGEALIGVAFATTGYAALLPDYLGLGDSAGLHPYHHARSEATAALDLLRAARTFCATNGFALTNRVFLTGYSQGGHATLALLREIEWFHSDEFTVAACAPMAGAYNLAGVMVADFLSGRPQPNPYYFAFLLAAYQDVYRLAPTLGDLLAAPYHTNLPPLLRGNSSGGQINAAMPTNGIPVQVLKPEYLTAFQANPRHPLRQALQENDLLNWTPRTPLRLYHCQADQDVPFANSTAALASFQARGVTQVELINTLPGGDHGDCVQPSLILAKGWFDSLR
jgi:hypothetical protein